MEKAESFSIQQIEKHMKLYLVHQQLEESLSYTHTEILQQLQIYRMIFPAILQKINMHSFQPA